METEVRLDENKSAASQTINDVTFSLNLLQNAFYKQKFQVVYTPFLSKESAIMEVEYDIGFYDGLTPFDVVVNNKSEYDLSMGEYQFFYIPPDGERLDALTIAKINSLIKTKQFPAYRNTFNRIKKDYPQTPDRNIEDRLFDILYSAAKQLKLINSANREIMSNINATGLLIFPVDAMASVDGKFTIREVVEKANVARKAKTEQMDFYSKLVYRYQKTKLFNNDKYKEEWIDIDEETYNREKNNPAKFYYNNDKKEWIEGEPPKEEDTKKKE